MQYISDIIFIAVYSIISCVLAFIIAPFFIRFLYRNQFGKQIRDIAMDGKSAPIFHKLHKHKSGTPTMGGVLVWGATFIVVALSRFFSFLGVQDKSLLQRKETYLPLATLLAAAILGVIDDVFNIKGKGSSKGINVKPKFFWLTLFAAVGAWWFYYKLGYSNINLPFIGNYEIGVWYIPLFMFVIISMANAVNFTDGLDGLAGGLLMIAFVSFGIISYVQGFIYLTALCGVIAGALVGFLWFNVAPAKFYMGDTGALSLGATLGVIAMLTNSAIILIVIGGVFVLEAFSVVLQITSKRLFRKKIFLVAPIHHHFEALGWTEQNIVFRFWIIGGMLSVIGVVIFLVGILQTRIQ